MPLRVIHDHFFHNDPRVNAEIASIKTQIGVIMATVQEMGAAVTALANAVKQVPGIVDNLEAKVTAAMNNAGMSEADKAVVSQAFDEATAALKTVTDSATDAADGIDEAAGGTGGGEVPGANPA